MPDSVDSLAAPRSAAEAAQALAALTTRPDHEARAREIYHVLAPTQNDDYAGWRARLVWILPCGSRGGIAFVRDAAEPTIWWVDVACAGALPGPHRLRAAIVLCAWLGAGWLVTAAHVPSGPLLERLGFDRIRTDIGELYSLELNGARAREGP